MGNSTTFVNISSALDSGGANNNVDRSECCRSFSTLPEPRDEDGQIVRVSVPTAA